jgi:hypothetical protein
MGNLHEGLNAFCACLESNPLRTCWNGIHVRFKQVLEIEMKHTFLTNTRFPKSYGFRDIGVSCTNLSKVMSIRPSVCDLILAPKPLSRYFQFHIGAFY